MNSDDLRWLYRDDDPDETKVFSSQDQPAPERGGYPDPPRAHPAQQYHAPAAHDPATGTPAAPPPAGPPRQRRRRKRRPIRRTILALFLLWLAFLVGTPIYAWSTIGIVDGAESGLPDQPGTAVLLVGTDGRADGSTGHRTDTMMLLYKPPTGKSVLLGLPRDSFVEIPGRGENKLNAAYAFGGPALLLQTVEHNTGIQVDGYLEIGMGGLVDMVDAVGGIEVCPEAPMQDSAADLDIPAGCQTIDGDTALAYVRMRKSDPRGDLGRMERQREVIGKIVRQAAHPVTFVNPVRYWQLNRGAAQTLSRTPETGITTMFGAGIGLVSSFTGAGISMTVPVSNPDARTSAGSSVLWDEEASRAVFDAIASGDTSELDKYHK